MHEPEHAADREREQRLEQRDAQMRIDLAAREPVQMTLQHLQRLAEEERRCSSRTRVGHDTRRRSARTRTRTPPPSSSACADARAIARVSAARLAHSPSALLPSASARSRVQLDEARRHPDLGHVARPRQIDRELADRVRRRSGRQHDHAVGERDRFLEIVRDEQHRLAIGATTARAARSPSAAASARRARRTARPSAGSAGSRISICASATRLRMPPESWCG